MSRIIVFTGPTIAPSQARDFLDADYRRPARVGDVLAAAVTAPDAIVLIDGLFESVPAVWHKEILFALTEGIHVYGSSSMGALRAAELHSFGMIGVGKIFEAFRSGALEDDDEVAVIHSSGPDCSVHSEAMVNIREGLRQSLESHIISAETAERLTAIGKALHYPDRAWPHILRLARSQGVASGELTALAAHLRSTDTNLKRRDAIELLCRVNQDALKGFDPFEAPFKFERTSLFEALRDAEHRLESGDSTSSLLAFAKLDPEGRDLRRNALLLALAAAEAKRLGIELSTGELLDHESRFLAERCLDTSEKIRQWLADNQLTDSQFRELLQLDVYVEKLASKRAAALDAFLLWEIRRQGRLRPMREALKNRESLLEDHGLSDISVPSADAPARDVFEWYKSERGWQVDSIPDHADLLGFRSYDEFLRELARVYLHRKLT